eukprot:13414943-Heterocapsa_arctica.AAC.1
MRPAAAAGIGHSQPSAAESPGHRGVGAPELCGSSPFTGPPRPLRPTPATVPWPVPLDAGTDAT